MTEQWMQGLLQQTLTLALAACMVALLQRGVVRRLGAAAAYLCWLLVPVAMGAVALPHAAAAPLAIHVDVAALAPDWVAASSAAPPGSRALPCAVAMASWAAGACGLAVVLARRQRRFEALVASASAGAARMLPAGAGPAVLGVWRRRIVLPQDFDLAFDVEERRLMLLHEGVHLRRADNLWNLLATALLVLHWFNPIAWWAWRRMRADQELSCDAAVLRHEAPAALAIYARALLKVQGVAWAPPLATSWQSSHPLVERVRMLKRHRISSARHRAGLRVAALSIVLAGGAGQAFQAGAAAPGTVDESLVMTTIEFAIETKPDTAGQTHRSTLTSRLLSRLGQKTVVRFDKGVEADKVLSTPVELGMTVTRLDATRLQMDVTLRRGDPLVAVSSPRVVTFDGEPVRIATKRDDGTDDLVLAIVPRLVKGSPQPLPDANDLRDLPVSP